MVIHIWVMRMYVYYQRGFYIFHSLTKYLVILQIEVLQALKQSVTLMIERHWQLSTWKLTLLALFILLPLVIVSDES